MVNWRMTARDSQPFDVVDAEAVDVETLFEIYLDVVADQQLAACVVGPAPRGKVQGALRPGSQ